MKKFLSLLLLLCPFCFAAESALERWIEAVHGQGSVERHVEFLNTLQGAVAADDREGVAQLIRYPLSIGSTGLVVNSAGEFITQYEEIFTESLIAAVVNQEFPELRVNSQGIRFDRGRIWFSGICLGNGNIPCDEYEIKIIAINDSLVD